MAVFGCLLTAMDRLLRKFNGRTLDDPQGRHVGCGPQRRCPAFDERGEFGERIVVVWYDKGPGDFKRWIRAQPLCINEVRTVGGQDDIAKQQIAMDDPFFGCGSGEVIQQCKGAL